MPEESRQSILPWRFGTFESLPVFCRGRRRGGEEQRRLEPWPETTVLLARSCVRGGQVEHLRDRRLLPPSPVTLLRFFEGGRIDAKSVAHTGFQSALRTSSSRLVCFSVFLVVRLPDSLCLPPSIVSK